MCKRERRYLTVFGILILCLADVKSQYAPTIPCPKLFQYITFGDESFALIILNNLPLRRTLLEVELTQSEPLPMNATGSLSLNQNHARTQTNLESGKPISYRIDFPNPYILPMLITIKVNGDKICSGRRLGPPNIIFKLQHTFNPTAMTTTSPPPNFDTDFYEHITTSPAAILPSSFGFASTSDMTPFPLENLPPVRSTAYACGREGLAPLIGGGKAYHRGKFPWLVAIYTSESDASEFKCDGSLISSRTVITTAQCFSTTKVSPDRISIYLGRHNLFISEEGSMQRDVGSMSFHFHNNSDSDADIVLLHMSAPVDFNKYISPVCLWSQTTEFMFIKDRKAYTARWASDFIGDSFSLVPGIIGATISSKSGCILSSEMTRISTSPHTFCVRFDDDTGPCIKTGASLFLQVDGLWLLRGISSIASHSDCQLGTYFIYYDVAKYALWIQQNMLN